MNKIEIKLKECCLSCEHFDSTGVRNISMTSGYYAGERVIACGHMDVCAMYNGAEKMMIKKKPVNIEKTDGNISKASCPSCGHDFPDLGGMYEIVFEVDMYDYCPRCGQAIDWYGI